MCCVSAESRYLDSALQRGQRLSSDEVGLDDPEVAELIGLLAFALRLVLLGHARVAEHPDVVVLVVLEHARGNVQTLPSANVNCGKTMANCPVANPNSEE